MKKLLPGDTPERNYFALPFLPLHWEVLKTALLLGVFEHLKQQRGADEMAALVQTQAVNTEVLLNALTALGYLRKEEGRFRNTDQTDLFLTEGKDTSLAQTLLTFDGWNQPALNGRMPDLVRNGPPSVEQNADTEAQWADLTRRMANFSRCGRAQHIAGLVSTLPGFSQWKRLLDLGAGAGLIGIAIAAVHPSLECHLFDRPAISEVAREVVAEYDLEKRVATIGGDYLSNPLGTGYDAIVASNTLNFCRTLETLIQVLEKCRDALNPGGSLIVFSDGLNSDRTQPTESVISWLATDLMGQPFSFSEEVLPQAILDAGFVSVRTKALTDPVIATHGPVSLHIAQTAW